MSRASWPQMARLPALRLFALIALLFSTLASATVDDDPWAPFESTWFDTVNIAGGLPHSITTAVAQDNRGVMWIGTMGGLARYDGYRMQVFETGHGDTSGLPDSYVRSLLTLADGGMLVGTNAGGLARFNPATDTFQTYLIGVNGTSDRKIYTLSNDHHGGVWIATDSGVDHLDLSTNSLTHLKTGAAISPRTFSVLQDRAGNLWLGSENGLFVRRTGSDKFVRPTTPDPVVSTVLQNQIWAIHEDREGRLWAGSGQAGAVYRDTDGSWHGVPGFSGYLDGARQPTVRDFLETAAGVMWIGTDGSGVMAYRPGTSRFKTINHDPAIPSSLPGNAVRALLMDRSGNLWAATNLGIARTNPDARVASSVLPSPLEDRALSATNVHTIYVDTRDRIWLGLDGGHIDMIDLKIASMHHLHLGGTQLHRDVQAFAEGADGTLWVGSQGLARIDPDTLAIQDSVEPRLADTPVLSMQRSGGTLLIGTYDGVYRYHTATRQLTHFRHDPNDMSSLASDTVREIAQIGNAWWYGTTRGISIAHDAGSSRGFTTLAHRADDPTSLPQDYIGSMLLDSRKRLWVSTFGGLAVLDPFSSNGPYRFRTISTAQGLASNKINAALPDANGNLWLSMSNGIAMVDGSTGAVYNLDTRDGLQIPSYIHIAAAVSPGGELLFGGQGGLTVIRPDLHFSPSPKAPLAITAAKVNGAALPFGRLPNNNGTLTLSPHGRSLQVGFALLDYRAPLETSYSYRMTGLDDSWTEIPKGGLPSAIYTNVPRGSHTLRLRAITRGMHPRTIETDLLVVVLPMWFETTWARIIALLLLILLIATLIHLRTLYLKRQARQLQQQIDEHTRDLRAANQRLDQLAGTDSLTGAYNRRRFVELVSEQMNSDRPFCIAIFDLDHFKKINDTYGHLAGDRVIRTAVKLITQYSRQRDLVGRYGGEEFVLCLPESSAQDALETAERVRQAFVANLVTYKGQSIAVTISAGVACRRTGESIEQLLSRADHALYEAKNKGRNGCVAAPE